MQETEVRSLIWEDPICHGTTKPQLLSLYSGSQGPQPLSPRAATTEAHELQSP